MDMKLVKEFIELAKSENLASLKYENDDFKISVSLPVAGGIPHQVGHPHVVAPTSKQMNTGAKAEASDPNVTEITSPFVGTFYRSSAPGEAPFVKVGDQVSPGKTLCILEAMKIMNEIDSDTSGEVVEVCVENESLVEYGQVLFKIRK